MLPAPEAPAGIRIDQLDPEFDVAAAFDAHHEAFADHWGETEETPEEFRHWLVDTPRFDRELSLLARDGPVVAGYVFARAEAEEDPSRGYVSTRHPSGLPRQRDRRGAAEARLPHAARPWQARLRPPRRLRLADGRHAPLRARRHDRTPALRHLGEGVAAGGRPRVVSDSSGRPVAPTSPRVRCLTWRNSCYQPCFHAT